MWKPALAVVGVLFLLSVIAVSFVVRSHWALLTMKDPTTEERNLRWHPELNKYANDPKEFLAHETELKAELNKWPPTSLEHMVALRVLADFYVRTGHYAVSQQYYNEAVNIAGKQNYTAPHPDEVSSVFDGDLLFFVRERLREGYPRSFCCTRPAGSHWQTRLTTGDVPPEYFDRSLFKSWSVYGCLGAVQRFSC